MRVRYRLRAQLDLENIYGYTVQRNWRAATEVIARIRHAGDRLGELPYMGAYWAGAGNLRMGGGGLALCHRLRNR
jgi:plasmid stabilization system protein ParE